MSQLSLATLLAIGDNVIIHKLRQLPIDTLLTLLRLPSATVAQVATVATADELVWLGEYLAPMSATEAAAVGEQVARGTVTVAALQAPPPVDADNVTADSERVTPDESAPKASVNPSQAWPTLIAMWLPWANNGVAVAAALLLLFLIAAGIVIAMRREMVDPPV
jgi:hypothetical protein